LSLHFKTLHGYAAPSWVPDPSDTLARSACSGHSWQVPPAVLLNLPAVLARGHCTCALHHHSSCPCVVHAAHHSTVQAARPASFSPSHRPLFAEAKQPGSQQKSVVAAIQARCGLNGAAAFLRRERSRVCSVTCWACGAKVCIDRDGGEERRPANLSMLHASKGQGTACRVQLSSHWPALSLCRSAAWPPGPSGPAPCWPRQQLSVRGCAAESICSSAPRVPTSPSMHLGAPPAN